MKHEKINPIVDIPTQALQDLSGLFRILQEEGQKPETKIAMKTVIMGTIGSFASGTFFLEAVDRYFKNQPFVSFVAIGTGVLGLNAWYIVQKGKEIKRL